MTLWHYKKYSLNFSDIFGIHLFLSSIKKIKIIDVQVIMFLWLLLILCPWKLYEQ